MYTPRGPKSPEQSTGRASVLRPRTSVLICVLMDSHGCPVCADGLTQTHTDVLCTSCVCWRTPTDVLCVLNRQPTWAKITQTVHGNGQRAESKDQPTDVLCVLMDTHGHTRTATDVLCVLADTHRRPVCTEQIAHVGQNHPNSPREGQRAGSKDQRADMCTDGQPRTSCVCRRTHTNSHGCLVYADGHTQTSCVC
ncbi:unnamed protein product [Brassica rapa]|uniref:Uncharacterized protein n=1 Tax=Brassica campestris TaxID=3711 RepID=A0A8D9DEH8_BRACM|nr:unnamed protein product [Brassica rapa]